MKFTIDDPLTQEEQKQIDEITRELNRRAIETPPEGREVNHPGSRFFYHVAQGVFAPRFGSIPLINNMVINQGDYVLDVGTGSGVIAINAAMEGAGQVLAIDINPNSRESVLKNQNRYHMIFPFGPVIDARTSDIFEAVSPGEMFDVITVNPPFCNRDYSRMEERATYDPGYAFHKGFFREVGEHLDQGGRIYIAQANFGDVDFVLNLADKAGFQHNLVGRRPARPMADSPEVFYAFELRRKVDDSNI